MDADGFTLEKMKVNERLASMEVKMDSLIEANHTALRIITGNGDPKSGLVFRVTMLEDDKEKKKGHIAAIVGTLGLIAATVISDIIHRTFFHK